MDLPNADDLLREALASRERVAGMIDEGTNIDVVLIQLGLAQVDAQLALAAKLREVAFVGDSIMSAIRARS